MVKREKPVIYFTVSMWNRKDDFLILLKDLQSVYEYDRDIALYVADFGTASKSTLESAAAGVGYPVRIWQLDHEFCNGMGHNYCLARIADPDAIVAVIAVDLGLPRTITDDIRQNVISGKTFYGPKIRYADKEGKLHRCGAAYALIAAYRRDFLRVGRLQQNMQWGGNHREGGEDIALMKKFKARGLKQVRPFHPALICRWHPRNVQQTFYKSYRRYNRMPWWDLVDNEGKPIGS